MNISNRIVSSLKQIITYDKSHVVQCPGYWPGSPCKVASKLPKEAEIAFERFKTFYLKDHSGRQLNLQPQLGQADLNAIFYQSKDDVITPKRHILQVLYSYFIGTLLVFLLVFYWYFTDISLGFYWDFTSILLWFYWDFTGTLSGYQEIVSSQERKPFLSWKIEK